jgi:outer membrane protein assembly factor BamB
MTLMNADTETYVVLTGSSNMTGFVRKVALVLFALAPAVASRLAADDDSKSDPLAAADKALAKMNVKPTDSPQAGRSHYRNNVAPSANLPTEWDVKTGKNVKWSAKLGSVTYATPVIANGKVYAGTNNHGAYLKRFSANVDLSVLLCFDEGTGKFLWQHSNEKAPYEPSQVKDVGICSSPYVEGNRLWYVTNRNEIVCLDTEGFLDGENDGPFKDEPNENKDEADVIWKFDMIAKLDALPHDQSFCSVTALGDTLFVCTSNGVDAKHKEVDHPDAASFVAMNKSTGAVLWTDKSPGANIMHGQWSAPACGVLGGVEQVIFSGGDGWLYSFDSRGEKGKSKLLWKFDCNPKTSKWALQRGTRNPIVATPVIDGGRVFVAVGDDPDLGEGIGHLWCIDPTKRGDVSPTQVFNKKSPKAVVPHKRLQACEPDKGDFERDNPNSAKVWLYDGGNPPKPEETMHRTLSSASIKDNLLFITDEIGIVHCLDATTGKAHWTHDMLTSSWSTPVIVGENVYVGNLDGGIVIFKLSAEKEVVGEMSLDIPIETTPAVANGRLFVATFNTLFVIEEGASTKPAGKGAGAAEGE